MIRKHELCKIAIVSVATILMLVNLVSVLGEQIPENTTIIWENVTDICQGVPLSYGNQLNASAFNSTGATSVAGTYYYNPDVGTVLSAGQNQPLHVTFEPGNLTNYNNSSKTVYINVTQCPKKHGFFHQNEYSTFLPFQWG
jgi:hypothetical protein